MTATLKCLALTSGQLFMKLASRSRLWFTAIFLVLMSVCALPAHSQYADPAISGANFTPISVLQGSSSELTISFVNSGSTFLPGSTADIPAFSIEVTVCPAFNYYTSTGAPYGPGGVLFDWVALPNDCWRGTNNVLIPSFGGGDIKVLYTGNVVTPSPQATNINIQIIDFFLAFENVAGNDNLQPDLEVLPVAVPNLSVSKTNGSTTVNAGGTTSYTVTISNSGTGLASAVSWADAAVSGISVTGIATGTASGAGTVLGSCTLTGCTGISIAAGGSVTYSVTANITGAAGSNAVNTANVTGGGCSAGVPANCTSTDTDLIIAPALTVTKTNGVSNLLPGQSTTYTVTIANGGAALATGVSWTDNANAGLTVTAITAGTPVGVGSVAGTCTLSGCTGISVAAAGSVSYTVTATVNGIAGTSAVNTANVGGGGCTAGTPSTPANCTSTDTDLVPLLTVSKTNGSTTVNAGGTTSYTVTISNSGTGLASAVSWADAAVSGISVTGIATGTASGAGTVLGSCTLTGCTGISIAAGGSVTYSVTANITGAAGSNAVNTANVTGGGCSAGVPANCTSTDTDLIIAPALSISKTASVTRATSGQSFTFQVTLTNSGTSLATGVSWTDAPASGLTVNAINGLSTTGSGSVLGPCTFTSCTGISIAPGGSVTYTVNVTKTITTAVTNTATITGGDPSCISPLPARCSSTSTVLGIPDLTPTFTFSATAYVVGDSRDVVINIIEINNVATSGPISFFVPSSAGFTYTFDPGRTSTSLPVASIQNSDWTVTVSGTGMLFRSSVPIPAGGRSRLVITSKADQPGTKANITVNITSGSGGEVRTNNNAVVLSQSIQR